MDHSRARATRAVTLIVLIAACGGSGETASTTTTPPTTGAPSTTMAPTTTTVAATTTTVALDCAGFGAAMNAIAQSFLYQTFDGGAAFERKRGAELANALQVVSDTIAALEDQINALGEPPAGYEGAIALMLEAIEMDVAGYADAAAAAGAGDEAALDAAVMVIDEGFGRLMSANVALSEAQACAG